MQLKQLRTQIDELDKELTALFQKRMELCARVAAYKKENGIEVLDGSREDEILKKISELCDADTSPYAIELYKAIFEISRSYQASILEKPEPSKTEEV